MKKKIAEIYNPEIKDNIVVDGVSLESVAPGQEVKMSVKGAITTFDPEFRTFMNNIIGLFINKAELETINRLLVHIKNDNKAYIYRDFPYGFKAVISGPKEKGSAVFKHEITDIESIFFEDDLCRLEYEATDKLVYLFRSNWSFGLYYNFHKVDSFELISKEIAYLYKIVENRQMVDFLKNELYLNQFHDDGWFPFNALVRFDYMERLITYYEHGKTNYSDLESLKSVFTSEQLNKLTTRWWNNSIYASKREILQAGIDSYLRNDKSGYINCIKVLVSEIEGILRFAFKDSISGKRIKPFLDELQLRGSSRYNSDYSLVFPFEFINYLRNSIFENFDFSEDVVPKSRHAYSHGVADIDKYTWERSLQIILTIDQLLLFI